MATDPVKPPPKPAHDAHYDEHSGVYGFFRRHQKKLLYTAGLFTLLTFSISGPMMSVGRQLFSPTRQMPTILVNGARVALTMEDEDYGQQLARSVRTTIPPGVLPMIEGPETNTSEVHEVFAILRRAAIAEGIEPSMLDVDKAIASLVSRLKKSRDTTPAKLARDFNFASLAQYRALVAEAMRVGIYLRLQTLAVDTSDARVLYMITDQEEKITLHVATFDEKKAEEALKAASPVSEESLKKWLDEKSERDKMQMQAYDPPRAEVRFEALLLAEGQFDPEQWKDDYLKDFTVTDDQLKNLYMQERENRFKIEADKYKELDDPAVKAELTRLMQAERVMIKVMEAVRAKQAEALKPPTEAYSKAQSELTTATQAAANAAVAASDKSSDVARARTELEKKPDDEALKAALKTAEQAETDAKNAQKEADGKIEGLKTALADAEKAMTAARTGYDFRPAFAEITKDKKGFVEKATTGRKSGEELKDLDAPGLELGLGKWPMAESAMKALRTKGDMGPVPARMEKAVALYQATDAEPLPLKPWEKLKTIAEGAYWTEQAKKQGEEKKKLMEETLLRLAKAKMPEKVAEIEGKKQQRIDDKLTEWEKKTQDAITAADAQLKNLAQGTQARAGWQQEFDAKSMELQRKDAQKAMFEAMITKAIEGEIAIEARKFYKDVLDDAAKEAGFTLADYGPYARELQKQPRFDKSYEPAVVFLWRGQSKLKEGEATDVLQDFSGRAYYVAVCTKVAKMLPEDVTRRDFQESRASPAYGYYGFRDFSSAEAGMAYKTAFSLQAVQERYDYQRPVGEARQASTDKTEKIKPADDKGDKKGGK
jgi:hypothetical protein